MQTERYEGDMLAARRLHVCTLAEAAERWGVRASTLRQWIKRGKLPQAFRVGGRLWLVP
ncbi:TPA: helix-turn-helix domain-containing protein [Candidatus Poribacteria bacterium]|nr:helix-turn-helix domain-containing protein [Candidatus Poribacteria bacterium]